MKIQPVLQYKQPKYPDKAIVRDNPNILKTVPERWKGNVSVGIALSSIIMMTITACGQIKPQNIKNNGAGSNTTGDRYVVAPLFIHGDGRGSFGCESVAPPAFLSEEEAFQVVQEEAKKLKLQFQKDGKVFSNIELPIVDIYPDFSNKNTTDEKSKLLNTKNGDLQLDGYDENNHIGFEFISRDDYVNWHKQKNMFSSVESFDFIPAAETLRKGLQNSVLGNTVGVFYDPMIFSESINKKYSLKFQALSENKKLTGDQRNKEWQQVNDSYQLELKKAAEYNLREQIKDFLNWLKAEGVI